MKLGLGDTGGKSPDCFICRINFFYMNGYEVQKGNNEN